MVPLTLEISLSYDIEVMYETNLIDASTLHPLGGIHYFHFLALTRLRAALNSATQLAIFRKLNGK